MIRIRSCNEVEVAKKLRSIRQHAYWISCYSPSQIPALWRPWAWAPEEAPKWLLKLDRDVRQRTDDAKGGVPDVVAWNDENLGSALFFECKGRRERSKEGQGDWLAFALQLGVRGEQSAVAVRPLP